jgi:hypothetical protein
MFIIKNVVKMFFNIIDEDVSAFEMVFFKLLYKKTPFGIFFNFFMKKIAETAFFHIISWENAVSAFFSLLL